MLACHPAVSEWPGWGGACGGPIGAGRYGEVKGHAARVPGRHVAAAQCEPQNHCHAFRLPHFTYPQHAACGGFSWSRVILASGRSGDGASGTGI